ncbi:MAG: hypothetical protein IJM02_02550 [Clostridia bacterium]|nr:hypothetical protein [Clostridia bacterium]
MTGLDKIIGRINADTESECEAVIQAAQKKCEAIIAEGEKEAEKVSADILAAAKREAEKTVEIAQSGAAQIMKQGLLKAKVDVISEVLSEALDELKNLPAEEYFDTVVKIASDNCAPGECKAKLSEKDRSRMPAGFEEKLVSALSSKGAVCTLSGESAAIESGILLDYGDIAVNCSFEAIMEENADEYKAIISKILF